MQSSSNRLVLDNYLNVNGVGRMLLDESVELRGKDLPQLRDNPGYKQRNLILAIRPVAINAQCADVVTQWLLEQV